MFARTKRLTLRPGWLEDAPALAAAIGYEHVVGNLAHVPWPYSVGDAEAFLTQPRGSTQPNFLIFEAQPEAPRLVGGISIELDAADGPEFGYWLTPGAWGRGYATEAGRQVVEMARHALKLRRLRSGHFIDNPASGRVLSKLGFRPTGRIEPRHSRARGVEVPCALFELDLCDERPCEQRMAA